MPKRYALRLDKQSIKVEETGRTIKRMVYAFVIDGKISVYFCKYYGKFVELKWTNDGFIMERGDEK